MHHTTRIASAVFLAAALTACTAADESPSDTATIDTGAISPAPATTVGEPGTPAATTGESDVIHVPLNEWSVTVSKSVIVPGTSTFHAMNQGTYTHAFEIEGNGQEWKSEPIPPGGTATLTPTLTPGTYTVYCPITDGQGNHRQKGMSTTFTVR